MQWTPIGRALAKALAGLLAEPREDGFSALGGAGTRGERQHARQLLLPFGDEAQ